MKKCTECNKLLDLSNFASRGVKRNNGTQATCRDCSKARLQKHRKQNREYLDNYKLERGCTVCGYNKLAFALHFDHTDPSTKTNSGNSRAMEVSWSRKRIDAEISKCTVLCANCHAEKTFYNKDYLPND